MASNLTPSRAAELFARGKWVNMIAQKYGCSEAHVEGKLMEWVRKQLEAKLAAACK